jgi:hypothetical protein
MKDSFLILVMCVFERGCCLPEYRPFQKKWHYISLYIHIHTNNSICTGNTFMSNMITKLHLEIELSLIDVQTKALPTGIAQSKNHPKAVCTARTVPHVHVCPNVFKLCLKVCIYIIVLKLKLTTHDAVCSREGETPAGRACLLVPSI